MESWKQTLTELAVGRGAALKRHAFLVRVFSRPLPVKRLETGPEDFTARGAFRPVGSSRHGPAHPPGSGQAPRVQAEHPDGLSAPRRVGGSRASMRTELSFVYSRA